MGANAKQCLRTQNKIIASKRELTVKTLNIRIVHLYIYIEKGDPRLRDSVKYFDYFRVTLSCNSVYREHVERY